MQITADDRKAIMESARVAQRAGVTVEEFAALLVELVDPTMGEVVQFMRRAIEQLAEVNATTG